MATYVAPLREIRFVLNDVLHISELSALPGFEEATTETLEGLLDEAAKLIVGKIAPLRESGDLEGCRWDNGEVITPKGTDEAYRLYWQGGWVGLSNPVEFGGQGLPYTLQKVVEEMLCSANVAFALYPGLTQGAFEAIHAVGSEREKHTFLPKIGSGEWTGTMCMTEPQAGSDVGNVKTRATPQADGSYLIDGSKIFITSGEHRLADNIVHFVLARLPDSPAGVRGLSTFIVPKFLPDAKGGVGERNGVRCVSIEHKMGIHGSCTCTLAFDGAKGWIAGRRDEGIQNMFVMMNMARIMVGVQGLGQCELATQNAIRYAQDRKQGKPLSGNADATIIEHPDVRRMLLTMKAVTEGGRLLAYETAKYVDLSNHHPDEKVREVAADWVELNTPLVKAYLTDSAFELGSLAVQVYGGHGFIRDHGIEQIVRDSKILCLYEGTNGIQSMDLVRRKLMLHNGRLTRRFFETVRAELSAHAGVDFIGVPLRKAVDELEQTAHWLQESFRANPNDAGFGAADFLRAFSLTYLGFNWLRMAAAADKQSDASFRQNKLTTAHFFAARMLPMVHALCTNVRTPASELMELAAADF